MSVVRVRCRDLERGRWATIAATPPYYDPNNQDGLEASYRQIASAVDVPVGAAVYGQWSRVEQRCRVPPDACPAGARR